MSLIVKKKFRCDVCLAEYDETNQELTVRMTEQFIPSHSWNQLIHQGVAYDLCMMCMAPIHHALKELVDRTRGERDAA